MGPKHDMTPAVDLTVHRGAGAMRQRLPVWRDLLPPCNNACPAGEAVQEWLGLAQAGRMEAAWQAIMRDNPLPAVHGRVCYHPCETACNRAELDAAVAIHAVERFLGDMANASGWMPPPPAAPSGRRVLVVGAGPSGLSAAYHLLRLGHAVEIRDAGPVAGGMLHFGIPAYRLPRADLAQDVARIGRMGARIVLNHKVADLAGAMAEGGFHAGFVAVGAHVSKRADIPARDAARVLDAVALLRDVAGGTPPRLGRRVVVYGGGNTAMDAARTARRLGAEEALIVYRRDRAHMPAHGFEADEALAEGVKIRWLTTIKDIAGPDLTVERMEIGADGRPVPTGTFDTLAADSVILALGQDTDTGFLRRVPGIGFTPDGTVIVGPDMMTGAPGIFAGGDMVPSQRTVTVAVGHGKRAARAIDAWLRGAPAADPPAPPPMVSFAMLNLPVYADTAPAAPRQAALADRTAGFGEVVSGLSPPQARREAQRCLSCGVCFECDNCYAACPEDAILKRGPGAGYRVDQNRCTGCAVCFDQCPCHAITMQPATAATLGAA